MSNSYISDKAKIGENVKIGHFCVIEEGVVIEDDVTIEHHCVFNNNVIIKRGTVVKSYVELRENTIIGQNCYVDSRVASSGQCEVEDNVVLRYGTILARGVRVGEGSYLCPRVMTNNLDDSQKSVGGAKIGKNCFIGTHSVLQYGITLGDNVTVGSMAFVNKDCESDTTLVGIPAKRLDIKK